MDVGDSPNDEERALKELSDSTGDNFYITKVC